MEFMEFINGKMLKVHDIDTACKNFTDEISVIVRHVQGQNSVLKAENDKLKSEHYKDKEIQRLQKEVENWKKRVVGSFEIDEDERLAIEEWKAKHIQEKHKGNGYAGAIGGRFKYIFTPTSIGVIGEIECSCGDKFCFKDLC